MSGGTASASSSLVGGSSASWALMFSFVGDTVLDPFAGSGSTILAAIRAERHSIGNEGDAVYLGLAETRIRQELGQLQLFDARASVLAFPVVDHTKRSLTP